MKKQVAELWLLQVDETQYWIDPFVLQNCERIDGLYLVDINRHTYLCELTPSYEARFVESSPVVRGNLQDTKYERLMDVIEEASYEEFGNTRYFSVSFCKLQFKVDQFKWRNEKEYNEKMAEAISDWRYAGLPLTENEARSVWKWNHKSPYDKEIAKCLLDV